MAVNAANAEHKMAAKKLNDQIAAKDAQIAGHTAQAKQAADHMREIVTRETETANRHANELRQAQKQIDDATQSLLLRNTENSELARQFTQLKNAGALNEQKYQESMRAVNSKGAQLREKINQMQTHSQQLGQQAHLEQVGFAAYRLRDHQESSAKIAALRDAPRS